MAKIEIVKPITAIDLLKKLIESIEKHGGARDLETHNIINESKQFLITQKK